MAIEWKDKYTIGDRKIDAEHQQLFCLANKFLLAAGQQSMHESSEAFSEYTHQHFFHEETLMREIQYPFTATHAKEHAALASTLKKIFAAMDQEVLSKAELEDFVGYWLVKHIASCDAPLAVYVRRNCAVSNITSIPW